MLNIATCAAAALALMLAFNYVAPADASFAYRDVSSSASLQQVNRAEKGDRIMATRASTEKEKPARRQKILVGCDPAFSNLSAYARNDNFAARCLA